MSDYYPEEPQDDQEYYQSAEQSLTEDSAEYQVEEYGEIASLGDLPDVNITSN